jgi:Bacterial Ig-like domain (group 2)
VSMRRLLLATLAFNSVFACPLWANWGIVQQANSPQTTGSTVSARFPTNVTAGDLIIVQAVWSSTTFGVTSLTDTVGNTFVSAGIAQGSTSTQQIATQIFYAANAIGGQDQVTATIGGSTFFNIFIYEVAGAAPINPLDVSAIGNGTGLSVTTGTATTTAASDFVFVGTGHHYGYDTVGAGFTGMQASATGLGEYEVIGNSGVIVSGSATLSNISPSLPWSAVLAAFKSASGGSGGGGNPTLNSIQVLPGSPTLSMGQSLQLSAVGTYSDNSTKDLTNSATWNSTNTGIATVSSTGFATAAGHGTTNISASSGSVTGSTPLLVEGALSSIQVTPANGAIAAGGVQQFTATGVFNDGTTENLTASASWSSSNTAVATINSSGALSAIAAGTITVTANSGGTVGSVSFTVNPPLVVATQTISSAPLVQTNFQSSVQYWMSNPPPAGGNSCSPAPCIGQTFLNPNTAGNMIFVWVSWNSGGFTMTNLSDTAGNTYTHIPGYPASAGTVDDFWVAYNVKASTNNKVVALFGSGTVTPVYLQIAEYSGMVTSNAFDVTASTRQHIQCVAPCTMSTPASPVTSQAQEMVLVVFDVSTGSQLNAGPGWTPEFACLACMAWESNLSGQVIFEHKLTSATGSFTGTFLDSTNGWPAYAGYLFTFKMAPY